MAKVEQEYKKEARERQSAAGGDRKSENAKIGSGKFTTSDYGRTSEKMASKIGVSEKTYRNMRTIVNEGTPEQTAIIPPEAPALHRYYPYAVKQSTTPYHAETIADFSLTAIA